jgi:integrase
MERRKRSFSPIRTKYPGCYFILGTGPDGNPRRIIYVSYRVGGKQHFEKIGVEGHLYEKRKLTLAVANQVRSDRMSGKEPPNREKRAAERAEKVAEAQAEAQRWTFDLLWAEWLKANPHKKGRATDNSRYLTHLQPLFGDKEPKEVTPFEVDRLRHGLLKGNAPGRRFDPHAKRRADYSKEKKQALAEQAANREKKPYAVDTVISILSLLRRVASFGADRRLCDGLTFKVPIPKGRKLRTEDMTDDQMARYIKTCREWPDPQAGNFQLLEIFTGIRRSEARNLKWSDIDAERGFIHLRDVKGGEDQQIPLNEAAAELLKAHPRDEKNQYVFAGERSGGPRAMRHIAESSRAIRDAAGLPKDFRPNHGLRHSFASHLASSGEVDILTLSKLLTHKGVAVTQRYAHLRDDALKRGSNVMSRIVAAAEKTGGGSR